ncbi:MAG: TIGR02147 family protein [Bdellovibrionales bacterium]
MSVIHFDDYRSFLENSLKSLPKRGHGEAKKWADAIGVNPVVVSQVMKATRDFTLEQGMGLAKHLGLDKTEEEYFLLLLSKSRSGTKELKNFYEEKLNEVRKRAKQVEARIKQHTELTDEAKATYYSNIIFSAIRLLVGNPDYKNAKDISEKLNLPISEVHEALSFLIEWNLVELTENGLIKTSRGIHIPKKSKLSTNHARNWRILGLQEMNQQRDTDRFISGPMIVDKKSADIILNEILNLISKVDKEAKSSSATDTYCLNIDWFQW